MAGMRGLKIGPLWCSGESSEREVVDPICGSSSIPFRLIIPCVTARRLAVLTAEPSLDPVAVLLCPLCPGMGRAVVITLHASRIEELLLLVA